MTGTLYPQPGNNTNLIGKLIPHFLAAGHEVHLFSAALGEDKNKLPNECFGVPIHWATDLKRDWKRKLLYPLISKAIDPKGFSDALQVRILLRELKDVSEHYPFEAVLSISEPFSMACASSKLRGGKKVLYIMDPPESVSNRVGTPYRRRVLSSVLKNQSVLITTPFIMATLKEYGFVLPKKLETVGFPMITENIPDRKRTTDGKIRLLFCGWLYSDIRSPKYFLDVVARLDERFEVIFMGKECENLQKCFPIETKATVITVPNQPYDVALQAISDADVLINIGNCVPVHMPSKTLEYINAGKPVVTFYKIADCPTLYYTKRYSLALNLFEEENNMDAVTKRFIQFCEENIGKTVNHEWIEVEYSDCTPHYITHKILESLE